MKFNLSGYLACLLLAITFCPLLFIGRVHGQDDQEEGEFISRVIKRQVKPSGSGRGRQEVSTSGTAAAVSAATGMVSLNNKPDSVVEERPLMQSAGSGRRPTETNGPDYNMDQNSRPPPRSKNPSNRRQPIDSGIRPDENGYEEDCSDDYYDDYRQLVNEPMRHIGRMMNSVFGQMSAAGAPMNSGNGWTLPSGGNTAFASSSAINSGDGYSRMTSSVSNNGRMRGIISETRNGRTQTRRIGRADDDDESYEDVNSNPDRYVNDEE